MQFSAQLCNVVQNAEQCAMCSAVCSAAQLVLRSWEGAGGASVFITNTGGIISLASFDEDGDDHITWYDVATGPVSQGGYNTELKRK